MLRLFIYTHTFIYIHIYLMSGRLDEARERVTLQKRGSESRYQGVGDRETSGRLIRPRLFIEKRRDSGTRRHDGKLRGGERRARETAGNSRFKIHQRAPAIIIEICALMRAALSGNPRKGLRSFSPATLDVICPPRSVIQLFIRHPVSWRDL